MGSIGPTYGIFRYVEPDLSIPPHDRAIYSGPSAKRIKEEKLPLHDLRTATDVARGVEGLDVQGFTYINHQSALSGDQLPEGTNAEDIYAAECIDLILNLVGAKRGVVHNIAFRRRLADNSADLTYVAPRGGEQDQAIAKMPKDRLLVNGRNDNASEPSRNAHVDMTLEGLRRTLRLARRDITAVAQPQLEAEDQRASGQDVKVPRYAAYSVWRPLYPVKRDPVAVLDYRSITADDIVTAENRIPSEIHPDGDYIIENISAIPPEHPENHRWYWIPEQKPDEVLIIKFADSKAEEDPNVAACCVHVSPEVPGTENQPPRQSVECRVYAFWE